VDEKYLKARQKLIQAVSVLATNPENIRVRLPCAYLILVDLSEADFPDYLQEEFKWVMEKLTTKQPKHLDPNFLQTPAHASVVGMRTTTLVDIAKKIFYISERLRDLSHE
jgi:hypothetical protein